MFKVARDGVLPRPYPFLVFGAGGLEFLN